MTILIKIFTTLTVFLVSYGIALGEESKSDPSTPFEVASVRFEQNATDGDVEIVFNVTGDDNGLAKLTVVAPDGRTVVDFSAPDSSTMGIRQFEFESPEPRDIKGLKSAYPEGIYTFRGVTVADVKLHGESILSHMLPDTVSFVQPEEDAESVSVKGLIINWTPVNNVIAYIIEVEQEDMDVYIKAQLPGSSTTFAVPDGYLHPDTEYKLAIGSVSDGGNSSYVETSFTTGKE